jgi:predicted AlkP superfamily pyrophosphatase or phosphodiesterase
MTAAGLAVTSDGANADLNEPIAWSLRLLSISVSDPTDVSDSEVGSVAASDFNKLVDYAELRLLQTVFNNLDDVDLTSGPMAEDYSDLAERLETRIARLEARLRELYGQPQNAGELGTLTLSFAEHGAG